MGWQDSLSDTLYTSTFLGLSEPEMERTDCAQAGY